MTEIRVIRPDEAERFLQLLCHVFKLDEARARSVFFSSPMYDLSRKWALFEQQTMVSILTTTSLVFGWGRAIGIAGVATEEGARRKGYAEHLLLEVLNRAAAQGEGAAMLFAHQPDLYSRLGFSHVDDVVRAELSCEDARPAPALGSAEVADHYGRWAAADPSRLVRDASTWQRWNWVHRHCEAASDGYVCIEPGQCREAVLARRDQPWPVDPGTDWVGLRGVATAIGAPVSNERVELLLMARHCPSPPQMFMTDQF